MFQANRYRRQFIASTPSLLAKYSRQLSTVDDEVPEVDAFQEDDNRRESLDECEPVEDVLYERPVV